jgi:hypothetical protein
VTAALAGCIKFGDGTTTTTVMEESVSFVSPEKQAEFERALTEAGVPFKVEVHEGTRYASWSGEHSPAAKRVEELLVGEPLPPGRSISFSSSEHQERFKSWLRESSIPYTTKMYQGDEYIIWDEANTTKVKSWKHFGPAARQEAPNPSIETDVQGLSPLADPHVER